MPRRQIHFPEPGTPLTPVIFRTWHEAIGGPGPDVIAVFPTERMYPHNPDLIQSYEHVGQHGGASYGTVLADTRPSTPDEIAPLMAELGQIGYRNLVIYRRWSNLFQGSDNAPT